MHGSLVWLLKNNTETQKYLQTNRLIHVAADIGWMHGLASEKQH
jgi:hypothetical protein